MDINATLLVEMVIFLLFFLLTKQYIWPPIIQVLDDRRATIEKGLRQADEAKAELAKAEKKAEETIHKAASTAKEIVDTAQKEAIVIINDAKKVSQERLLKLDKELEAKTAQAYKKAQKGIEEEMLTIAAELCQKALLESVDTRTATKLIEAQTRTES